MTTSRRRFLLGAGALAAAQPFMRALAQPRFEAYPYTLGVASGYPQPDGITLWTRLAPRPLEGGGMPPQQVDVRWEIAEDERFTRVAQQGTVAATAEWAHSVHVDVTGLQPARWYWYRFTAGDARSPVGRTRTAPAPGTMPDQLTFAFASCQQYEQGYYVSHKHLASENLDLVVFLGDYIYESSWGRNHVRAHGAGEPQTLDEYRARYALYKGDTNLQAAHLAFPWIVTWDDHEVQNDYANDRSQLLTPPDIFLARRAAAYRAYYEHMPLPASAMPSAAGMRLYSRLSYGSLAQFHVLDNRQYRSHQPCARPGRGGSNTLNTADCPERDDPRITMLGSAQEQWLDGSLTRSQARWNVIAQQTLMAQVDRLPGDGRVVWTDGWDGYPQARDRLLRSMAGHRVANPVVLGGDVHVAAVTDLKLNFDDARSPAVATEFVCPSITSQSQSDKSVQTWLAENPHLRFVDRSRRGYGLVELTPGRWTTRFRGVSSIADPNASIRDVAAFIVEDGKPGAQRA
jgi:alkaline phosphatase D